MVIHKIGNLTVQLVKGNFATRKQYHFKVSTRKFIILNFSTRKKQLVTRKIKFFNFQLFSSNTTCKIVKLFP